MMNPEIKARWLEKLRSGEYLQGTGYLKAIDDSHKIRYCCLGVLCEIAVEDGILHVNPGTVVSSIFSYADATNADDCNETILPDAVAAWAGINSEGLQERNHGIRPPCPDRGEYLSCGNQNCGNCYQQELTTLNDEKVPFTEIADIIEKWF